jgi:hypothetical protein
LFNIQIIILIKQILQNNYINNNDMSALNYGWLNIVMKNINNTNINCERDCDELFRDEL